MTVLEHYLDARQRTGAPSGASDPLFWQEWKGCGYSYKTVRDLLARVIRRAGLKPAAGRIGPRVHDLRHTFVVHRMTTWYREGANPQARLPYLATYLGHRDIHSTLVYLTITQELLRHASERFHSLAAPILGWNQGGNPCEQLQLFLGYSRLFSRNGWSNNAMPRAILSWLTGTPGGCFSASRLIATTVQSPL